MLFMLFNLDFANSTILLCFFFSQFINLYFLIAAAVTQVFNPIAELLILTGVPSKEAKTETEIHPLITEAEIRKS